jgi:hypothetical protein
MRTVTTTVTARITAILFIGLRVNSAVELRRGVVLVILIFLTNESHPSTDLSCHAKFFFSPTLFPGFANRWHALIEAA